MAKKTRKGGGSSRAVMQQPATFGSHQAQQVYKRTYENTSRNFYILSVVLRTLTSDEEAVKVEEVVNNLISEMRDRFKTEIARLKKLCEDGGVTPEAGFTSPMEVVAEIATPHAAQYLGLIRLLDETVGLISALWLSGARSNSQHSAECYQWQRNLTRCANRIQEIGKRATDAANRAKQEEEVEKAKAKSSKKTPAAQPSVAPVEAEVTHADASPAKADGEEPTSTPVAATKKTAKAKAKAKTATKEKTGKEEVEQAAHAA